MSRLSLGADQPPPPPPEGQSAQARPFNRECRAWHWGSAAQRQRLGGDVSGPLLKGPLRHRAGSAGSFAVGDTRTAKPTPAWRPPIPPHGGLSLAQLVLRQGRGAPLLPWDPLWTLGHFSLAVGSRANRRTGGGARRLEQALRSPARATEAPPAEPEEQRERRRSLPFPGPLPDDLLCAWEGPA